MITGVGILSYYAVIAGWTVGFIFKGFVAPHLDFAGFTGNPLVTLPLFAAFILLTIGVVLGGVESGIERTAKVLMPVLLVLMMLVILRGLTLPGAMAGLRFYLKPDFSQVTSKTANLRQSGAFVAVFGTLIAVLAGFMIFPAVFALGQKPDAGPNLIFNVLPAVFDSMRGGALIAVVFFFLLCVAALTSTVSLLEVVAAYFIDEKGWTRTRTVWAAGAATLNAAPMFLSRLA